MDDPLTRLTIQFAVACYLGRVAFLLTGFGRPRVARWLWTVGCVLCAIHIACAFQFHHDWSLADAYRHTAERTAELTGWNWGGGLYVNFLFATWWIVDAAMWWRAPVEDYPRSRLWFWITQGVFAFIVVNATVVFGPAYWWGIAGVYFVVLVLMRRRKWDSR